MDRVDEVRRAIMQERIAFVFMKAAEADPEHLDLSNAEAAVGWDKIVEAYEAVKSMTDSGEESVEAVIADAVMQTYGEEAVERIIELL